MADSVVDGFLTASVKRHLHVLAQRFRRASRNALDCALWDLEARQRGQRLWQVAGCDGAPTSRVTAYTISLGTPGAMAEQAATRNPSGRMTTTADVARVIAMLAGDDAQWITGTVIGVDGGEDVVA